MDSEWFQNRMDEKSLTQEDVGKAIHRDRSVVSRIINGEVGLQLSDVQGFAQVLETCAIEILYRAGLWDTRPELYLAPVINSVEAGSFAETIPNEPPYTANTKVVEHPNRTVFALTVTGDSMDRIAPEGSLIVIDYSEKKPSDGELFVFRRHGEATFKRYRKDKSGVRLEPDSTNPRHTSIFPENGEDIEVIGRVIDIRPEYS